MVGLFLGTGCSATVLSTVVSSSSSAGTPPAASEITAPTVFDALQQYWRMAFPAAFGSDFIELRGGIRPLDSGAVAGSALCIGSPDQLTGNAFYCPDSDGIVYDTGVLVPVLLAHYGPPGLVSSLAHEFGHSVAARIGVAKGPAMLREAQADCFAGNFLVWAAGGNAPLPFTVDDVLPAMAPLLDFGDQVTATPTDASAHGLAIDRAQAVQLGYRDGPTACRDISTSSIAIALGRFDTPADRSVRTVPAVTASAADTALAAPIGQFALAAAARLEASEAAGVTAVEAGCQLGSWTAGLFGKVPADQLGGRLSDPDEALNLLRARPGATTAQVFSFLDGFAGRCT